MGDTLYLNRPVTQQYSQLTNSFALKGSADFVGGRRYDMAGTALRKTSSMIQLMSDANVSQRAFSSKEHFLSIKFNFNCTLYILKIHQVADNRPNYSLTINPLVHALLFKQNILWVKQALWIRILFVINFAKCFPNSFTVERDDKFATKPPSHFSSVALFLHYLVNYFKK